MGKESARLLAAWNATVIMAVRNPEKGLAVLEDIKATTGSDRVEVGERGTQQPGATFHWVPSAPQRHP